MPIRFTWGTTQPLMGVGVFTCSPTRRVAGEASAVADLAEWFVSSPESPFATLPEDVSPHDWFDLKVIYQQSRAEVGMSDVPEVFLPRVGPFEVTDSEKIYAVLTSDDIFERRQIDRRGAIVVVRPDQYVAAVLPLDGTDGLAAFFEPLLRHSQRS